MPLPGLSMTISPGGGASAAMIAVPGSPAISRRPIGPGSPMRSVGVPRWRLAGGQSDRSGLVRLARVDHRPAARAPGREQRGDRRDGRQQRVTSLPSEAPKPPGSTKSRCMSMTTSAVVAGANG